RSCRGSTKPSTRPSACSNGETAWRRHRSIGKVQGGGTWFFSGKWKCLSHFSLPEPCLAFLLPRAQKPTPKRPLSPEGRGEDISPLPSGERGRGEGGRIKILDFGLAHFASEAAPAACRTGTGVVLGTVDYITPE